jgi:probable rRNA maturation factor
VTDVLSFEYKKIPLVGEVVICLPQVKRQGGKNWKNELIFMLIHGILHLCGYDHEKGEKEAKKMEKLQEEIFEGLKLCSA